MSECAWRMCVHILLCIGRARVKNEWVREQINKLQRRDGGGCEMTEEKGWRRM